MDKLYPEKTVIVEHSVGGLLEECEMDLIQLTLPLVYNIIYGDIMNEPMYIGKGNNDNIHGQIIMRILKNNALLLSENLLSLDFSDSILEIFKLKHNHENEDETFNCEACELVATKTDFIVEVGEAILLSMPYHSALRQFMAIEGNSLSVAFNDNFSLLVTAHGIESMCAFDKHTVDIDENASGLNWMK